MKKIIYLSAIVFPIAFAACSQEELVLEQGNNNSQVEVKPGIEGARIAAKGMNISLNHDANSRLAATGWENGDKLGVAWVTAKEDFNDLSQPVPLTEATLNYNRLIQDITGFEFDWLKIYACQTSANRDYITKITFVDNNNIQYPITNLSLNAIGDKSNKNSLYYYLKKEGFIDDSGKTKTLNIKNGEFSDTRYVEVVWPNGSYKDQDGIMKYAKPIAGISRPQGNINWYDFATVTDEKLYANLMYEYTGSSFGYYGDIYEGAYFAYWPFERLNSIKTKNFNLNMSQNINNAEKFYLENAVSVSAIDSVYAINEKYEPVIKENISKSFSLVRVANAIFVNTQFTGSENVSNLKISSVSVAVNGKNLFSNKADFYPHKLPVAVYTKGKYDKEETLKQMEKDALIGVGKAFNITEYSDKLEATPSVDMPIASENSVCMLTYPTIKESVVASDVVITVNVKEDGVQGNVGYFTIDYSGENPSANDKANNDAISKLAALLNGGYTLSGKTYSLQEFNSVYFNIPVKLDMKNYTSIKDWEVNSAEKWNQTIDAIDALNLETANIKVTDNITFKGISPKFPKTTKITVNGNSEDKLFTLEDVNAQINSEVSGINYTVKKDATLTIEDNATVNGTILVDGTLNVLGEAKGTITVTKSAYNEGVVNLGAEGIISDILNNSKINVTEGTNNIISSYSGDGKVYATVTNGTNAANIINNVHATDITFSNANISTTLNAEINYTTEGNTTFTGNLGTSCHNLIVKNGTLTIGDNSVITVENTTINSGAKLVVATGNNRVVMTQVINNGTVELQKDSKGKQTIWNAPEVTGTGSVILNGNIHNKN